MSYLAGMGVTAIFGFLRRSDNSEHKNIPDGGGNPQASYHGYQGRGLSNASRNTSAIAATPGLISNAMVTAAHANGIKVIIDFAPNHSHAGQRRRVWLAI